MKSILSLAMIFIGLKIAGAQLPFKYDNTSAYKAIYLNQLSKFMDENPGYLLLDVRSPGEYADTFSHEHMNMGKLKGALNISIDSISQHLDELKKNAGRAIFVYCSHSQRSRRVSKLLSENGFKKIYNINGGMSVVNGEDDYAFPDKDKFFVNDKAYKNISSRRACEMILNEPGLMIIDLRDKEQFESRDTALQDNIGRIKNAINIPEKEFKDKFAGMHVAKDKKILLYDEYGNNSAEYAKWLAQDGYTNVYHLFGGIADLITNDYADVNLIAQSVNEMPAYKIVGVKHSIDLMHQHPKMIILDARPEKEFANKSEKFYLNIGHIQNAIHIDEHNVDDFIKKMSDGGNKESFILVYGSGGNPGDNGALVCKKLTEQGFKNIYFLYSGLYSFVWSTANIENCKDGRELLTDHDGLY